MVAISKYFPEGVATGDAFINREEERNHLKKRIRSGKHSVLMAPRKYGKTSLVIKVSNEMKIPYCAIDLFAAYNEEYVRDQIVDRVSRLVFELLPKVKKAKQTLIQIFSRMKPEISIGAFGQRLLLNLSNNPLKDITELLLKLDETAHHFNKKAVVFMDEFQQISMLENYHSIEASIRHAVERSKNIAYVFSGSNRHLLKQMFGDQSRPLYRLCKIISLDRMAKKVYIDHLQFLAKKKWKKMLADDVIEKIFELTELHPFYLNILCQALWEEEKHPSTDKIINAWHDYVKSQRHVISYDIMKLSHNQQKLITALAKSPVKEIQASQFTSTLKISASSAQQSTNVLIRKDLVHRDENGAYSILDPAMKYYLNVVLWENK